MKIENRKELIEIINNSGVDTSIQKATPDSKIFHTIIHKKENDCFYRVIWGEILDEEGASHLWYSSKPLERVFLNESPWQEGWLTRKEIKEIDLERSKEGEIDMSDFLLHNVENNMIDLSSMYKFPDNINLIGAQAGKGKTFYSIRKAIEALKDKESVLYFSTDSDEYEVKSKMIQLLYETRLLSELFNGEEKTLSDKLEFIKEFIAESNLEVYYDNLIDLNYIIKKMKEKKQSKEGLDFVVIDSLILSSKSSPLNNVKEFKKIQRVLEDVSDELSCRVLITTQLNSNYTVE